MFVFTEIEDPPTDSKIIECHIPGVTYYTKRTISNSLLYKDYEKEAIAYVKRQLARELTDRILDKQFEAEEKKEKYNSVGYNEYLLNSSGLDKWYEKWSPEANDFVFSIGSDYKNPAEEFKLDKNSYHAGGVIGPVINQENEVVEELTKYFGDCLKDVVKYPCSCKIKMKDEFSTLKTVIIHLNDHCQWTREEIADWLETLDIDITLKEE